MELYFLLLATCLFIGIYLTNRFGAKIFQLNFASWYYLFEFITMSATSVFFITSIQDHNWALSIIPHKAFPHKEVLLTVSWCAIAIPIGFILSNILSQKLNLSISFEDFLTKAKSKNTTSNYIYYFWLVIIFLYVAYVIHKIGFIPQLQFLSSELDIISKTRGTLTHSFPASNHLKELVGMHITVILCYGSLSKLISKKNIKNFLIFITFLLLSTFFLTLNLNKSGLVILFVGLGLTIAFSTKFNLKKIIFVVLSSFSIAMLFFSLVNNVGLKSSFSNAWQRIIFAQSYGNYISYYVFPEKHPHIGLNSISKQIKKLNIEYTEPASRIMMKVAAPEAVKAGTAGFMVSAFFAEAWANWGIIGVILSPIYVGFFIKFLISLLINLPKSPLTIGLLVFSSHKLGLNMGFNQFILPRYIIISFLLIILSDKFLNKLTRDKSERS